MSKIEKYDDKIQAQNNEATKEISNEAKLDEKEHREGEEIKVETDDCKKEEIDIKTTKAVGPREIRIRKFSLNSDLGGNISYFNNDILNKLFDIIDTGDDNEPTDDNVGVNQSKLNTIKTESRKETVINNDVDILDNVAADSTDINSLEGLWSKLTLQIVFTCLF